MTSAKHNLETPEERNRLFSFFNVSVLQTVLEAKHSCDNVLRIFTVCEKVSYTYGTILTHEVGIFLNRPEKNKKTFCNN